MSGIDDFISSTEPTEQPNRKRGIDGFIDSTGVETDGTWDVAKKSFLHGVGRIFSDDDKALVMSAKPSYKTDEEWLATVPEWRKAMWGKGEELKNENNVQTTPWTTDWAVQGVAGMAPEVVSLAVASAGLMRGASPSAAAAKLGTEGSILQQTGRAGVASMAGDLAAGAVIAPAQAVPESSLEANGAYEDAIKAGYTPEQAAAQRDYVMHGNVGVLSASDAVQNALAFNKFKVPGGFTGKLLSGLGKLGTGMTAEGVEEGTQEALPAWAQNKEANTDRVLEAAALGALGGGVFHAAGKGIGAFLDRTKKNGNEPSADTNNSPSVDMPEDIQAIIDGANKPPGGTTLAVSDGIEDSDLSHTNASIVQRAEALNKFAIDNFGQPLIVSGGWRSPENNARSNGAENSRHLSGDALDISTEGLNDEQRQLLFKMAGELGFDTNEDVIYHDRGSGYHMHLQDAGAQQNAQQGRMSKETFFNAVAGQESGGDYSAENGRTGAFGKYQIMPDNWPSWSQEAGLEEGAPMTPENQEKVARYKLGDYYDKYGPEGALVAWYSGEGNAQRWAEGKSTAMGENGEYSWDAKQGKGDEPSIREYVQQSLGRAGAQPGRTESGSSIADSILNSPPMFSTDGGIIDFASYKYNTSTDPGEVNFFADMMDKNDKFINTPENRKAVEDKYGDELKAYLAEQEAKQDQKNLQELAGQNQQPSLEYALMEAQAKNKHAASLEEEAARLLRINSSSAQGKALLEKAGAYRKSAAEKTKSFSDKETEQLRQQGQPQAPAAQPTNLRTQVMPELLQALQKVQAAKFDQAEEGSLNAAVQSEEKAQQEREAQKQAVLAKKAARAEAEQRLLQLTGNQGSIIAPSSVEQPTQEAVPTPGFLQTAEDKIEQKQRARVTDALNAGNIRQAVGLAEKFNRQDLANIILSSQPQQHGGPIVIANAAKGQKLYTTVKETGTKSERREYGASLANVVNAIAAKRFDQAALQGMPQEHQLFYDFLKYYQVTAQKVLDVLHEERDNEINQHVEVLRNQWNEPGTKAVVARTEHGTPITRNYSGKFQWQQQLEANGKLRKAELEPALRQEAIRQLSEGYIDPKYGEQVPREAVTEWNKREAAIHGIEDYIQRAEPFEEPRATGQDLRGSGQDDLRREVAQQAIAYAGSNGTDGSVEGRQEVKQKDVQKSTEIVKGEPINESTTPTQRENAANQIQNPEPQPSQTAAAQENVTDQAPSNMEEALAALPDAQLNQIARLLKIRKAGSKSRNGFIERIVDSHGRSELLAAYEKVVGEKKVPSETPTNSPASVGKNNTTEKTQEEETPRSGKAAQQEAEVSGKEERPAKEEPPSSEQTKPQTALDFDVSRKEALKAKLLAKSKPKKLVNVVDDSDAALAEALADLKGSLDNLSANPMFNPDLMGKALRVGLIYAQRGVNNFAEWSEKMTSAAGDKITPYLPSTWSMINSFPEGKKFDADTVNELFEYAGIAHKEGHTTEEALSKVIAEDLGEEYTPFAKMAYNGIKGMVRGDEYAERTGGVVEPDGGKRESAKRVGQDVLPDEPNGRDGSHGQGSEPSGTAGSVRSSGERVSERSADDRGTESDTGVRQEESWDQERSAGSEQFPRSGNSSLERVSSDPTAANGVAESATNRKERTTKRVSQRKADKTVKEIKAADLENIQDTLPSLFPEQQQDVAFIEARHAQPEGYGVLITNGTGTGKTYTGLGVIKRFVLAGKDNILVLAPSDKISKDWVLSGLDLDLHLTQLPDTKTAGTGVVVTTYANFGQNREMVKRNWDLIVTDEAHYLSSSETGNRTAALDTLRKLTYDPRGFSDRLHDTERKLSDMMEKLNKEIESARNSGVERDTQRVSGLEERLAQLSKKFEERRKVWYEKWDQIQPEEKPRVLFLSATPFAYVKNIDYGSGYLFNYGKNDERHGGYNAPDNYEKFFMEHFGYRMRYNKLTTPEADVNSEIMERNFHQWLRDLGVLSGRMLTVDKDYDRHFVLVDDAIGAKLDEGLKWLNEAEDGRYRPLYDAIMGNFKYHQRMYLLEAIKARHAVGMVKEYVDQGKKVVVFHDFNKGGGFSPFKLDSTALSDSDLRANNKGETPKELYHAFCAARPDLLKMNFDDLQSPIQTFKEAFGDKALFFNGTVSKKNRLQNVDTFNEDGSGNDILVVQSDAGREGISLHDRTGKHQRVLINLGMPVKPTAAIQIEGRIYRVGQASDAIFRYLNTGTSFEQYTFANKISERASTAENLALGEDARALKQSFVDAFDESGEYPPGMSGEGTGGKEADKAERAAITPFQKAMTYYFAQQKKTSRNKAREGNDYFATPEPVGLKMVEWANLGPKERALEPSAGHGAISRFFSDTADHVIVEPSYELAPKAAMVSKAKLVSDTFENYHIVNKFHGVVMNPPFGHGGATAVQHIAKASKHLYDGGRIVAVMPEGPAADKSFGKWFDSDDAKEMYMVGEVSLPSVTFNRAGTGVKTRIVVLEKQTNPENAQNIRQKNIDLSNADSIKELFDRIEDISMPDRQEVKEKVNADAGEIQAEAIDPEGKYAVTGNTYAVKDDLKRSGFRWNPEHKAWVGDGKAVGKFKDQASEGELKSLSFVRKDGDDSYKIKRSQDASADEDAFSDEDLKELLAYRGQDVNFIPEEKINSRERSIASMGETMGVKVRFFVGASSLRGFHFGDVTYINRKGNRGPAWTFWHEHMHWLRNNDEELYQEMLQAVEDASHVTDKQVEAYRNTIALGDKMKRSSVVEEMLADELADAVSRRGLLESIATQDKSLFYRLGEFFQKVIAKLKAAASGQEEQRDSHLNLAQVKALEQQVRQAFGLAAVDGKRLYTDRSKFPYKEVPAYSSEEQESEQRNEEDTDIRYSADSSNVKQTLQKAWKKFMLKLGLKTGWRAGENVTVEKEKTSTNVLKTLTLSPSHLAKLNPAIRVIYNLALKSTERNEMLRNKADRQLEKIEKLVKGKGERQKLINILMSGDMSEIEWTNQELRNQGLAENIIKAYRLYRGLSDYFYRLANNMRQRAEMKSESIDLTGDKDKDEKIIAAAKAAITDTKFNEIVHESRPDANRYVITWREPKTYKTEDAPMTTAALEELQNNPDVQITRIQKAGGGAILPGAMAVVRNDDIVYVSYIQQASPINKRKGHVRHFFESFIVYEKGNDGNKSIASFGSLAAASRFANKLDKSKEYIIKGKTFHMPGAAEAAATIGDAEYFRIMNKVEDMFEISSGEAKVLMDDLVRMKNKHRFLGSVLHRTGADGYEQDALWAMRRHTHEVARYVALDPFKSKSRSFFERWYGKWDGKHTGDAEFLKGFISDVNGEPTRLEEWADTIIKEIPAIGNFVNMHGYNRPTMSLCSTSMKWTGIMKLGFSFAAGIVNLTQCINAAGKMGSYRALAGGFKRLKKLSLADARILKESGVETNIGFSDLGAGYTASSRYKGGGGKVSRTLDAFGNLGMLFFGKVEKVNRAATILGAYHQGIGKGMSRQEALNYAKEINLKANFDYGIHDTPRFMRMGGPVTQAMFQFEKYPVKQMELMWEFMPWSNKTTAGQKLRLWLPLMAISGVWGIPGFALLVGPTLGWLLKVLFDAEGDDWETIVKNYTIKAAAGNKALEAGVKVAWYGVGAFAGIDISKRVGIGEAGSMPRMPDSAWEFVMSTLGGPAGRTLYGFVTKSFNADPVGAVSALSPAAGGLVAAWRGHKDDDRGRPKTTYDTVKERLIRAAGFRTIQEAEESDAKRIDSSIKRDDTKKRQKAIDAYVNNPTKENRDKLRELRVSPSSVRTAVKNQSLTDYERSRKSMTRDERRRTQYLDDFVE